MHLFRVILPVGDIEAASTFYADLLDTGPGERVSDGRHYFDCQGVLLACWDPLADGDPEHPGPNPGTVYLSTPEPLDRVRDRTLRAGARPADTRGGIAVQPWGERSFYVDDPWGNPLCVVEEGTEFRGGSFHGRSSDGRSSHGRFSNER